jgi:hypothetical protein
VNLASKKELRREAGDLWFFNSVIMPVAGNEKFHDFGRLQMEMSDFLDFGKNPHKNKAMGVDRHSYKTTVLCGLAEWLFCWYLVKHEPMAIAYNTATQSNAENFGSDFWFFLQENDTLNAVFSDVLPASEREYTRRTKTRIQVGNVKIDFCSFEEQQVSRHYGIIINDDLENDRNVATDTGREDIKRKWQYQKSILSKNMVRNTGWQIEVGTPYHYQGLMWDILTRQDQYDKFIRACVEGWPNVSIADVVNRTKPLTDPENKTYEGLMEILSVQKPPMFSGQYLIKPYLESEALCMPEWIEYYDRGPENYWRTMVIDIGGSNPKEHDATGITVVDTDENGTMYVRYAEEVWLTPMNIMQKMSELIELWHPDDARMEREKYSTTIADFFEHDFPKLNIGFVTHERMDKAQRIWRLKPWLEKKKIKILKEMKVLEDQLLQYTGTNSHFRDDVIDSLAYHLVIRHVPDRKTVKKYNPQVESSFEKEFDEYMAQHQEPTGATSADSIY